MYLASVCNMDKKVIVKTYIVILNKSNTFLFIKESKKKKYHVPKTYLAYNQQWFLKDHVRLKTGVMAH